MSRPHPLCQAGCGASSPAAVRLPLPLPLPSARPRGRAGRRRGGCCPAEGTAGPPGACPGPPGDRSPHPRTPPTFAGAAAAALRQKPSYTGAGGIAAPARFHAAFGLLMARSHRPARQKNNKSQLKRKRKKKKTLKPKKKFKTSRDKRPSRPRPRRPPAAVPAVPGAHLRGRGGAARSGAGRGGARPAATAPPYATGRRRAERPARPRTARTGTRGRPGREGGLRRDGAPASVWKENEFSGGKNAARAGGGRGGGIPSRQREIKTAWEEVW